jgi:hypothetical protein
MSGSAQRREPTEVLDFETSSKVAPAAAGTESALKQAVAERLAAHRSRRAAEQQLAAQVSQRQGSGSPSQRASTRVRDAVAARYEQSVSYREFLAVEAERALAQAQAEAEVAARNAQAVAEAKMQLMEEIEQWNRTESHEELVREAVRAEQKAEARGELAHAIADIAMGAKELIQEEPRNSWLQEAEARSEGFSGGLSIQLYNDVVTPAKPVHWNTPKSAIDASEDELLALEQEIEFRMAPERDTYVVNALPIPGNLIEFPRQLVASRKARPRLAEGPLREDAPAEPQLRIFEVDPEQISLEPVVETSAAPEWQSLQLESTTAVAPAMPLNAQLQFTLQPQTASIELRLMAAAVDFFWLGAAFVGFVAVAVELAGDSLKVLPKPLMGASAAVVLLVLYVLYQMLFFTLSGDTPGMRYARIGLCTFGDRNPTRKAMRRRVLATLLAACPLGLGLAWACLDEERLGWHDRMSRMYHRAY